MEEWRGGGGGRDGDGMVVDTLPFKASIAVSNFWRLMPRMWSDPYGTGNGPELTFSIFLLKKLRMNFWSAENNLAYSKNERSWYVPVPMLRCCSSYSSTSA